MTQPNVFEAQDCIDLNPPPPRTILGRQGLKTLEKASVNDTVKNLDQNWISLNPTLCSKSSANQEEIVPPDLSKLQ